MAIATLNEIKKKVRRLTRSLSTNILSEADLEQYINTFVLYDFPEHLRLFNLESTFEFYTEPYKDVYETSTVTTDPLYDFKNKYISVHPPFYIAGNQALFSESREQFFNIYPMVSTLNNIGTGDALTTSFTGTIPVQQSNAATNPIVLLKNNVIFSSVGAAKLGLTMIDYPISATLGNLYVPGGAPTSTTVQDVNNYINYVTGQYVVTFVNPPGTSEVVNSQVIPVKPSRPQAILFYDTKFTVRPVPDKPYKITMNVFKQPVELLADGQNPELNEWYQYIAYGSAKKVFEDRMDLESVQMIMPEFKKQESLINRRTVVQQTSQRTPTIYTENNNSGAYGSGFSGDGQY